MKKRVFSLIVAAAMLFGMLPITSLGAGAEVADVVHPVVHAAVTVDGVLTEPWYLSGSMTGSNGSRAFGTLWDSTALYLAVNVGTDTAVTAEINNHELNITDAGVTEDGAAVVGASVAAGQGCWEIKLPWAALDVELDNFNVEIPATLQAGNALWSGTLLVSSLLRNKTSLSAFGGNHFPNGKNEGMAYEALEGGFRMANLYVEGAANKNSKARVYAYQYMDSNPLDGDALVLEYTFRADAMPVYGAPESITTLDGLNACYGFTFIFGNNDGKGFSGGITNTTDGLYLCLNGIPGKEVHTVKLNKQVGDTFRVRMERTAADMLNIYVDDVLVDAVANSFIPSSWGRTKNVMIVNLYSGSENDLTADKANDVDFTVTDMRYGCTYDDLLKDLSFADIKGENAAEALVAYDLTLPSSYTHPLLGCEYDLTWSSSNTDLITDAGKVAPGLADTAVEVTATIDGDLGAKTFSLVVPRRFVTAYFTPETMTADGVLDEYSWRAAASKPFAELSAEGAPAGAVSVLMNDGIAYMAVTFDEAEALALTLGEKSWNVDLTKATFSDTGIEGAIGEGVVELKLDMVALGMPIRDYNQTVKTALTLSNGQLTSSLDTDAIDIAFVSKSVVVPGDSTEDDPSDSDTPDSDETPETNTPVAIPGSSGMVSYIDVENDVLLFDGTFNYAGVGDIWQYRDPNAELVNLTKDMLLEQTLDIDALADKYYITYEDQTNTAAKYAVRVAVYNSGNGALSLVLCDKSGAAIGSPIALGKNVGDAAFKLGLLYSNRTVKVYVDDVRKGTISDSYSCINHNNQTWLDLRCGDATANFTVSNIQVTVEPVIREPEVEPGAPVVTDITGANYTVGGVFSGSDAAKLTVSRPYWIKQPMDAIDFSKDMLIEQTLQVTALTGTGVFTNPDVADGLLIRIQESETVADHAKDLIAAVLYNDNGLKLKVLKNADGTASDAIDLGKAVGATFKLGLRYSAEDDTITVLVDGTEVGSVEKGVITYRAWGAKTFAYHYHTGTMGVHNTAVVNFTDMKITTYGNETENEPVPGEPAEEVVDMNMQFNTIGNFGYVGDRYFLRYELTGPATSIRYCVDKNTEQALKIDPAKELLYEQTLTVANMPVGESTMTGVRGGNGYIINVEDATNGVLMAALLYNSGDDGLKLQLWKGTAASEAISLGKKTGEEFTLGLKWEPDATVTVYVDGVEKGSAQITAASMGQVQKGDSFGLYYQYANCGADEKVTLVITDMKLTVSELAVAIPEVVDLNMNFNAGGNFKHTEETDTLNYTLTGPATSIRYWVDKNAEQDTKIDPAKELLYEQTLTVADMPVGESTMTGVRGGDGYIINVEDATNGILMAALLYNSGDDGLKLQLWKGTAASEAISLGKKTGEEFTLGLKWEPDATVTVYVDGVEKGSAQITAASMGQVQKGDSFGLYYQYANCGADEKVTLAITDMKLTITEPVPGEPAEEVVDMNMQFNTIGNFAYIADRYVLRYELTGPATSIRYCVDKNAEQDTKIDPAKELLYEQTLTVANMPVGESTMTGVRGGNGYIINVEDATNGVLMAALLYNSGDDGLKLQLWKGTAASEAISLGKKTGEEFTLGLKWEPDATVTVYVDGVEKGSAQITAASMGQVQKGDSFGLYYQYANCGADEKVTLVITDMKLTITEPVSDDSDNTGEPAGTTTAISNANYTVGGLFTNNGTGAKLNVSRAYWFSQPTNTGLVAVDFTKDMLLEQTLTVTKLPTSTGAFSNLADTTHFGADGLLVRIQESKTAAEHASDLIAAALYNDGTSLKLNVLKADGTASDAIDLGKAVGATFKLGLRYNANDDTITVLVDDVEKGAVASGVYNFAAWGLKTVGYSYKDFRWDVTDAAAVTIASIKLTTSEPEQPKGVVTPISSANYVSSGVFVNDGTGAKLTSSNGTSVYWIKQPTTDPGLTAVDFTKDMLLEQTINITSLPVSAGDFVSAAQANGLQIKIQEAKAELVAEHAGDFITAVMYNDGTGLKLKVMKADGTASDAIDLGKTAQSGVSFKLGIQYSASDDTITVFVDGVEKGAVEKGVYNYANWSRKTVAYNYSDSQWETGDTAALTITDIQLTVSEPAPVDPGEGEGDEGGNEEQLGGIAIPLTGTVANSGYAIDGTSLILKGSAAHATHQKAVYWIQQTGLDAINLSKDMLIEQTLTINKMIAGDGSFLQAPVQVNGLNIVLEEAGQSFAANIFNSGSGLKLNVLKSDGSTQLIDLGKDLGDTFRLGLKRTYNDILTVYVDGEEKGTVSGVAFGTAVYNKRTMLYYYRDANCVEGTEVDITIADVRLTVTAPADIVYEELAPLSEEISAAKLLPGIDLTGVAEDIDLPESYASQWLGNLPITWSSTNETYLTAEGKVTRPSGKVNQYSLLTPTVVGGPALWTVEATILTTGTNAEQTPAKVMTAYTAADETGSTGIDSKWSLNNKILVDMEKAGQVLEGTSVAGTFGVRWGLENLYLAVKTGGKTLGVTVNGAAVDLSDATTAEDITYVVIPYADVDLDAPTEYGVEISAEITLDDAKWEGSFCLTSNENFIIDGAAERVWSQMSPGKASVGISAPDNNQGVNKTATGWNFYDRYNAAGANPESIRSYVVLWAKGSDNPDQLAIYEPMNDREHATYAEFDFYAAAMPEYLDGVNSTGWSAVFASYGFTWALCASDGGVLAADGVSMGIYNTAEGLTFVVQNLDGAVKLNRYVGDRFRLGTRWNTDGSLTVYVDGEEIAHLEGAEKLYTSYGSNSLIMNLIRNTEGPTGSQDNFDVYIDNISLAKGYGDTALEFLTYQDLLGENTDPLAVTKDLTLPETATNEQTGWVTDIQWESDHPEIIDPATGKITAPESKGVLVTLTGTGGGDERVFQFYVQAKNYESQVLMAVGDTDTAHGAGTAKDLYTFALDSNNSSIILDQGASKKINVITLTDGDAVNRLNESFLSIWVSDDNVTYTRVDEYFKLLRDGEKTYLYDFEAEGRYVKVHCTHYDGAEADFIGSPDEMIAASYEDVFGAEGQFTVSKDVTVTNSKGYTAYDDAWSIDLEDAGVVSGTEASIRAYLGDELLYHYVEDGKLIVRIDKIAAGGSATVTVLSGNETAADISNKEGVYEVVYGTREMVEDEPRRWICSLGDGRLFAVASGNNPAFDDHDWTTASDVVDARRAQITWSISEDGGLTWSDEVVMENAMSGNLTEDGWINSIGGITYDPNVGENGRLIFNGYYYVRFAKNDVTASFCQQRFMYSDDLGKTWVKCPEMTQTGDHSYYNIGYDDVIRLSCFDGEGPNNDYIMTVADQANNNGGFCLRVVYSKDGGETWILGDQKVDLEEGSGITAIESGVSEGFLIETEDENGDSLLVLYSRCQYANSTKFAFSTSSDYGLTWKKAVLSSVYASAGQPVMNPFGDANLMIWGGNHALGANSYNIMPLTVGVLSEDMRSVSNIQDLYSRYSTQGMTDRTEVRVINQSADSNGDTMSITFWSRPLNLRMRIDNFTDYLYRTKGIYDSFENSTVKYEGWSVTGGVVAVSGEQSVDGSKSMKFDIGSSAVRTVPYLQDGTVTMQLYVANAASADFTVELEAAYSDVYGTAAPVAIQVIDGRVYMLECSYDADGAKTIGKVDSGLVLANGWNEIAFTLNLSADEPSAKVAVNGSAGAAMPVDPSVGSYVCYVDINTIDTELYADAITVIDTMPEVVPEPPAEPTPPAQTEEPKVEQVSITLDGTIGVNFWMTIPEEVLADEDAYMKLALPNGTTQTIYLKDVEPKNYNGKTYYIFSGRVAAKEMTEDVVAQFFYGEDSSTDPLFYSVKRYADYLLENSNDAKLVALLKAMLHYGAYAQEHFQHNTDAMANADMDPCDLDSVTKELLSAYAKDSYGSTSKVSLYSISLILRSETTLRFFFRVDGDVNDVTFTYNGEALTPKSRGGYYYVDVLDISADDLDADVTIVVSHGEETAEVTCSPLTYCYNVLTSEQVNLEQPDLVDLVKAMYLYNIAADAHFE